ncbi:MAG TPA: chromate transporter [Clostridiales bacterium]|nr:chromate transporter [Clostridiales bacterium]
MIYLTIFLEFFKVGLFAIGGGLATLPFLQELICKYGWITSAELIDMIAISESTPGPIGINAATFVGYKTAGVMGGLTATIGLVTPSIIIVVVIAHFFMKFSEQPIVRSGFYGLRPAVTGLIASAGFEVAKVSLININRYIKTYKLSELFNYKEIILFLVVFYLISKYKKHPVFYLIGAAIIGILFKY